MLNHNNWPRTTSMFKKQLASYDVNKRIEAERLEGQEQKQKLEAARLAKEEAKRIAEEKKLAEERARNTPGLNDARKILVIFNIGIIYNNPC